MVGVLLAAHLPIVCGDDALTNARRGFAGLVFLQVTGGQGRDFNMQINAVKQRARQSRPIAAYLVGGAFAAVGKGNYAGGG